MRPPDKKPDSPPPPPLPRRQSVLRDVPVVVVEQRRTERHQAEQAGNACKDICRARYQPGIFLVAALRGNVCIGVQIIDPSNPDDVIAPGP